MTHVFYRKPLSSIKRAVRGEGIRVFDAEGKAYIDASSGAAVSCLGYNQPDVIAAIKAQLDELAFVHSSFFTTAPGEELADFLAARSPGDLNHVYFLSGGSEAVEAALKLARQYFVERGEQSRSRFIARRQSYHGNTLGALAIGGNEPRRRPYQPMLMEAEHVSPCYAYRGQHAQETEADYAERLADELDANIRQVGSKNVAAFIMETVVGSTLGAVPPVRGYLGRIREVCDRHGVLLILDEVMSGMGRTGYLFACEEDGVVPDIAVIAKGLGAGYQPIGAILARDRVYQTITGGSGYFQHGHTYMAHATACAAGLAVQRVIERDHLLENVRARGDQLRASLHEALDANPYVGDIRGRGLFVGIELVRDRETKATWDPALKLHARFRNQALADGLMTYPMGGTVDGVHGDHILLAPPFICTDSDIDTIVERLVHSLATTIDPLL